MPFKNPEDKRAWRREYAARPHIKAKQIIWDLIAKSKKEFLGIPLDMPIDPIKRQRLIDEREERKRRTEERRQYLIDNAAHIKAESNKHQRAHRARQRSAAIEAMGGECEWCGYDIHDALEFDHIEPLYRNTNGVRKNRDATSIKVYRGIIDGSIRSEFQLLCSCCHAIKTRHSDISKFYCVASNDNKTPAPPSA